MAEGIPPCTNSCNRDKDRHATHNLWCIPMQVQRLIETVTSPRLVIDLPGSFVNHRVEILVLTLDDPQPVHSGKKRTPPPQFAGRVKELGDVMSSVPLADWGITE